MFYRMYKIMYTWTDDHYIKIFTREQKLGSIQGFMTNNVAPLQAQGMLGKNPAERQQSAYYICNDHDGK